MKFLKNKKHQSREFYLLHVINYGEQKRAGIREDNVVRFMLLSSIGIKCKNIAVDLIFDS